jgi:hypothetical protein
MARTPRQHHWLCRIPNFALCSIYRNVIHGFGGKRFNGSSLISKTDSGGHWYRNMSSLVVFSMCSAGDQRPNNENEAVKLICTMVDMNENLVVNNKAKLLLHLSCETIRGRHRPLLAYWTVVLVVVVVVVL